MFKNPFIISVIPPDGPFCDRSSEIEQLISYALAGTNVVIFSPRRFGKTSLVKRVQSKLAKKDMLTLYADFFGITSIDAVAGKIARSVYAFIRSNESLMKKAIRLLTTFRPVFKPVEDGSIAMSIEPATPNLHGIDLLDKTLHDLGQFIEKVGPGNVHIVFDEFQEITELRDKRLEGTLRAHIQFHQSSYFFVGSRRHILLGMFNERSRPFYQSAQVFELKKLPHGELVEYLMDQFQKGGKRCPEKNAEEISLISQQYPYYSQKLALNVFEVSGKVVHAKDIVKAMEIMVDNETYFYQATLQALAPRQIALLRALAAEPSKTILSNRYISKHDLGSVGGVQSALKKLRQLDLIEKDSDGCRQIVDPIFRIWLQRL
ncbi:MAG: ATP-binding protein [Deltaproteobacteria bacterium]|nr:ATP-binding protein [Deltaproteobacteria bacterium]